MPASATRRRRCRTPLIDEIALVGPPDRIRDRLQAWQDIAAKGWVGSLILVGADAAAMRVIAEAVL